MVRGIRGKIVDRPDEPTVVQAGHKDMMTVLVELPGGRFVMARLVGAVRLKPDGKPWPLYRAVEAKARKRAAPQART